MEDSNNKFIVCKELDIGKNLTQNYLPRINNFSINKNSRSSSNYDQSIRNTHNQISSIFNSKIAHTLESPTDCLSPYNERSEDESRNKFSKSPNLNSDRSMKDLKSFVINENKLKNKIKLASIYDETKNLIDKALVHEKQIGQIKINKKNKIFSIIKNFEIDSEKDAEEQVIKKSKISLSHKNFMKFRKKLNILSPHKRNVINDKNKITYDTNEGNSNSLDSIEIQLDKQINQNYYAPKVMKIQNENGELKNLNSLAFIEFKSNINSNKIQRNPLQTNNAVPSHNTLDNVQMTLKKNLYSLFEYSSRLENNGDFDYISNLNKGFSMKSDMKNTLSEFINDENCRLKINDKFLPEFIKTKFKKKIVINEFLKNNKVKSYI